MPRHSGPTPANEPFSGTLLGRCHGSQPPLLALPKVEILVVGATLLPLAVSAKIIWRCHVVIACLYHKRRLLALCFVGWGRGEQEVIRLCGQDVCWCWGGVPAQSHLPGDVLCSSVEPLATTRAPEQHRSSQGTGAEAHTGGSPGLLPVPAWSICVRGRGGAPAFAESTIVLALRRRAQDGHSFQ